MLNEMMNLLIRYQKKQIHKLVIMYSFIVSLKLALHYNEPLWYISAYETE